MIDCGSRCQVFPLPYLTDARTHLPTPPHYVHKAIEFDEMPDTSRLGSSTDFYVGAEFEVEIFDESFSVMQVWGTRVVEVVEIEIETEDVGEEKGNGGDEQKEEDEQTKAQILRNAIFATRELLGEEARDAKLGSAGHGGFVPMVVEERPREDTMKERLDILGQAGPPTPKKGRRNGVR